jgi:SAM-dependent methyltransferase
VTLPDGLARSFALLDPGRRPPSAPVDGGYLDLGGSGVRPLRRPPLGRERRFARALLELGAGDHVLDVGCGRLTADLARIVGERGLVVGVDGSGTRLARAAREAPANVALVRADPLRLPFRDESFDAVCCFGALQSLEAPWAALDEMARVLARGGRIALMTSCRGVLGRRGFGRDELTAALAARGFGGVRRRLAGAMQFVGGRR